MESELIKEFSDDVILQLKEGAMKQFKGYMYLNGGFRKGSRIVKEQEVREFIYQFWKTGTISLWK